MISLLEATPVPQPTAAACKLTYASRLPQGAQAMFESLGAEKSDALPLPGTLQFDLGKSGNRGQGAITWTYLAVARFPTVDDEIALEDLQAAWRGEGDKPLLVPEGERGALTVLLGDPAGVGVTFVPAEEITPLLWEESEARAIIPFEQLNPRLKVLKVDGADILALPAPSGNYPLRMEIEVSADAQSPAECDDLLAKVEPNLDPDSLLSLNMTGVTALVRGTARTMNEQGITYPARDIRPFLRAATLTHLSNEVSFSPACSPERAASPNPVFCSPPEYVGLLQEAGADVIELTGNHNLNFGSDAYVYTLDLYQEEGWQTYGGGRNQAEAAQPLLVEFQGTRLAFLGCNEAGPDEAWAGPGTPGAARCDMDRLAEEVTRLSAEGILPIVTLQSFETDDYMPAPMQRPGDYRRLAEAGAVIVSGSQAHFPQGFAFFGDHLVHYGLGNLFFDQMEPPAARRAFIDTHYFYRGRYLNTRLTTTRLEEFARPRYMTAAERSAFLTRVFTASHW